MHATSLLFAPTSCPFSYARLPSPIALAAPPPPPQVGPSTQRTTVRRGDANPQWDERFVFDVTNETMAFFEVVCGSKTARRQSPRLPSPLSTP